jgi:NTE family protein
MTRRRGLVLGGGGIVGLAWENGLIQGLADGGVDLREADVIVGTSAGSLTGSQLAAGVDFTSVSPDSVLSEVPTAEGGIDAVAAASVMEAWLGMETVTEEGCAVVGERSRRARTASQESWIAATGGALEFEAWPERDLRISVVDVMKGQRRIFDRASNAPIERVIAASCSVPGLFPAIEIDGTHYMDGGVWSGTHADVLANEGLDDVFVIAPLVEGVVAFGRQMDEMLRSEIKTLAAVGCNAHCVFPESGDRETFGPNMMDGERVGAVLAFARDRGRSLADADAFPW